MNEWYDVKSMTDLDLAKALTLELGYPNRKEAQAELIREVEKRVRVRDEVKTANA